MESEATALQKLSTCLENSISSNSDIRRKTEQELHNIACSEGCLKLVLTLVGRADIQPHIRQAASIFLKNTVKRNWRVSEGSDDKISQNDRDYVRNHIVDLMLLTPDNVQRQLSEAVSLIGCEDFPAKWQTLLPYLVSRMQTASEFNTINGVLQTANSLFKKYRHEVRSDELWTEIKYVLSIFAAPLTELFTATVGLAAQFVNDANAIKTIYGSLVLIAKIFYSLNYQDLPEYFEDHLSDWMPRFLDLLKTDIACLKTDSDTEPSLVEQLRSQICDNVAMYAQKYEEEFQPFLQGFVQAIWQLLISTGIEPKFDLFVCNGIQFLASVCERPTYKSLFEDSNTLAQICEKIIVPNMEFRESDQELFEDNPEEYIRRDVEGSDADTRRRAACDFVRSLCKQFEAPVMQIFALYVQQMLVDYSRNPERNWAKKDAAIYLVTSLVARGGTARLGITISSKLVDMDQFYRDQILVELKSFNVNAQSVLKADALKFVVAFRSQLPIQELINVLPFCVALCGAESTVVHTYAANAFERLLTMRVPGKTAESLITTEHLRPQMDPLLKNLFEALNRSGSQENEYVMKCIMRCISTLQEAVLPYTETILAYVNSEVATNRFLTKKLLLVAKNPTKPHFNHYLFETFCVLIRATARSNPAAVIHFEKALFPPFTEILVQDVAEFMSYTFQILGMMLEMHRNINTATVATPAPISKIPEAYMELFPHLLLPALWERPGNATGLVKLLQAYLFVGAEEIVRGDYLNKLLGTFQKLIASKANDHEGFYLLNSMFEHIPKQYLQASLRPIFSLLFQRLQSSKTQKYVKGLIVFLGLYLVLNSADELIQLCDGMQPGLFGMLLEKIIIPDLQKVGGSLERKIAAVGMTKLLYESPEVVVGKYSNQWPVLLQAIVGLFELPEDESVPDDEHYIDVEDTPGYSCAYSQLAYANKVESDPTKVADARVFLAEGLQKFSLAYPSKLNSMLQCVDPIAVKSLQNYMIAANVQIVS